MPKGVQVSKTELKSVDNYKYLTNIWFVEQSIHWFSLF